MIVDSHAHLLSPRLTGQAFYDNWFKLSSVLSGRPEEKIRQRLPEITDETGDMLIDDMDKAEIDYSIISIPDFALARGAGEPSYGILELNKICSVAAQKYPNRLIPLAGVDPRRDNAIQILEVCINEFGMKGIKLQPSCGFYPNERYCYQIYEFACDNGLPVLVHTGPHMTPYYSKYCYPIYLDDPATDFPELRIILAHAAYCWWPEALSLANNKTNLYFDLSGWQPKARHMAVDEFYKPLRIMLNNIGPSRILFGSDYPAFRLLMSSEKWVNVLKNPPEAARETGMVPNNTEVDAILGGSAAKLFNIQC